MCVRSARRARSTPRARSSARRIPPPSPPRWSSCSKASISPASSTRTSSPVRRATAASRRLQLPVNRRFAMRSRTRASLAIGLALAFSASVAWAQAPTTPPPTTPAPTTKPPAAPGNLSTGAPGVVMADVAVINATVEAVDKDKRTVTLKGSGGRTVTLKVGPNAKNFDQIKAGDKVKGKFLDSVALFVRKAGTPPDAAEMQAVSVAPPGPKPKAMTVDSVAFSAKVEKNYTQKRL